MIFYFSGTGNSLYLAARIAEATGEDLVSIAKELDKKQETYRYQLREGETLGFVYPVYAWAPPRPVLEFVKKISVESAKPYAFSLATCGGEEGKTASILEKQLAKRGLPLAAAFSVIMPNNYILGYDVDSPDDREKMLADAELRLEKILEILAARKHDRTMLIPGGMAALKSGFVNAGFNRFALKTDKFYAEDTCTGCGLCEKICPVHTIKVNGKPSWGKDCTMCLACINRCPAHAIQYGNGTAKKGRYVHAKIAELEERVKE